MAKSETSNPYLAKLFLMMWAWVQLQSISTAPFPRERSRLFLQIKI